MRVTVALDPGSALDAPVQVVVDCIRATSTIAQAIAAGYDEVVCVGEIDDARAEAAARSDSILGGERRGVRIDGFDCGNSPGEYLERRGRTLVLSTTNGTRAILQATRESRFVFAGSLLCLDAVVAAAAAVGPDVAVRCAGVRGAIALDDVYVAGRIVLALGALGLDLDLDDAATTARSVALTHPDPLSALTASQSARDLLGTGHERDVARCAAVSTLPVAPRVVSHDSRRAVLTR
jgi:2-phosphosulfolactate phosphatase